MENFDRENIDELLEIRQIRQYFPIKILCRTVHRTQMNIHNREYSNTILYI